MSRKQSLHAPVFRTHIAVQPSHPGSMSSPTTSCTCTRASLHCPSRKRPSYHRDASPYLMPHSIVYPLTYLILTQHRRSSDTATPTESARVLSTFNTSHGEECVRRCRGCDSCRSSGLLGGGVGVKSSGWGLYASYRVCWYCVMWW